jgi:ABC-type sugar transport system permease subunit
MFPGLALIGLIVVPPVLAVLILSLFRIELGRDDLRPFVGLHNYIVRLPIDAAFLDTVPRTLAFASLATVLAVPIALGSALLVNGRRGGANALGLVLLLPWAVAPIAAGVFWRLVFDQRFGLVNAGLAVIGVAPVRWTTEAIPTLVVTLVAVVWRAIPLLAVLLLGALRAVPPALARAARMDGATSWQVLRYVTLPAIRPTVIVVCVVQVVLSLQVFDILFAISSGRPRTGGDLSGYAIYSTIIDQLSFGYGSALTVVLAAIIAICLLPLVPVVRRSRSGFVRIRPDDVDADSSPSRWLRVGAGMGRDNRVPVESRIMPARTWETALAPNEGSQPYASGRRRPWPGVGRVLRGIGIVALIVWLVGPIVWLAIASLQPESALRASPPSLSLNMTLDGYTRLITDRAWQGALIVSVVIAVAATALAVVVAVLAGYPLARFQFRGSRAVLGALLLTQLMPPIALAIPVLFLVIGFGLKGTVVGLIIVNAAFWAPILVWLVRAAFLAVPISLEAAARMDGAGRVAAAIRVALPAAGPAIAAAAVIVLVGVWNDFVFEAAIGTRTTSTLPRFLTITADPPYHVLAAGILLTIAPCLVLVAALHRRILRAI